MNTAVVNIKIEPQVKRDAQKLAQKLGLPLSALIKAYLKQIIRRQEVAFSLSKKPSKLLLETIEEARKQSDQRK